MSNRKPWSDGEILAALTLQGMGWTCDKIGCRLRRSKNSVVSILNRVANEYAASEAAQ